MLIFPLKKEWYEKIKAGEKTVEYREVKPYWTSRLVQFYYENTSKDDDFHRYIDYYRKGFLTRKEYEPEYFTPQEYFVNYIEDCGDKLDHNYCRFRLGYTNNYLIADIRKIEIVNGKDTDLHIDKPVYAIHFIAVREVKE